MVHSMRLFGRKLATIAVVSAVLLGVFGAVAGAQTNPTAQAIPYTQNFASLTPATVTAYPAGWQGWVLATSAPGTSYRITAPTADKAMTPSGTAALNAGAVYNYLDKPGFLNSSSFDQALCLAINTTGQRSVVISYDIMTIRNPYDGSTNTKIGETTLQ